MSTSANLPEPWLRGPIDGVDPLIAPVLRSYQQAVEDLTLHSEDLTTEQIWSRPSDLAPLGFQLHHIAGSVDRLTTYLRGEALTDSQIAFLKAEMDPGSSCEELLGLIRASLSASEAHIRTIDPAALREPRFIGKKRLPTTVAGLLLHLAEHTQRHVGQAISAAKLARVTG